MIYFIFWQVWHWSLVISPVIGETLGVTPQHLMDTISGNNKAMYKIFLMAEALENGIKYMDTLHNFS